jgi:tyrosyl-tRNA synthetase
VAEIIDQRHLQTRLRRRQPLRVKLGIDPTNHHLHLGHAVTLRKLHQWQEAGHQAVLIIGDYTARVGDPSGRDSQRRQPTLKQINEYAAGYLAQAGRLINIRQAEVHYNSEWYERFSPEDLLKLIAPTTLQQLLVHETFRRRLDQDQPLGLLELIYPLLQGYDSVMVKADVEIGGLDQKFNLLTGRDIQTQYQQEPQDIMLLPYLIGLDGKAKMGKSMNNYIALTDTAGEMFGKIMSIPDKLITHYFELATDCTDPELAIFKKTMRDKKNNPRDLKAQLARAIVTLYHGQTAAEQADREFVHVFRGKGLPKQIPHISLRPGQHQILNLLVSHQLVASRSAGRRLIEQGGLKINSQVVSDWQANVTVKENDVIQLGRRTFVRIHLES